MGMGTFFLFLLLVITQYSFCNKIKSEVVASSGNLDVLAKGNNGTYTVASIEK